MLMQPLEMLLTFVPSKYYETPNGYNIGPLWSGREFRMDATDFIDDRPERRCFCSSSAVVCFYNNIDN